MFGRAGELADVVLDDLLGIPPAELSSETLKGNNDSTSSDERNHSGGDVDMTNPAIVDRVYWQRSCSLLLRMREYVAEHQARKWSESWGATALPVLQRLSHVRTVDLLSANVGDD